MKVLTQAEADRLNSEWETEPYLAANGHLMIAPVGPSRDPETREEREYRVGDEVRYTSWNAWCAPGCNHTEAPPDW